MSIEFSANGSPVVKYKDKCHCVWEGKAADDCTYCAGTGVWEREYDRYSCQFSNMNAMPIIRWCTASEEGEYCGRVEGEELQLFRNRLVNRRKLATWDDDLRRIDALLTICEWAIQHETYVSWG